MVSRLRLHSFGRQSMRQSHYRSQLTACVCMCGLWHGASWTFLAWGLYHGLFLCAERVGLNRLLARLPVAIGHGYAMLAVLGGWVLFRSPTFEHAFGYYAAMFGATSGAHRWIHHMNREVAIALWFAMLACMPVVTMLRMRAARWQSGLSILAFARTIATVGLFVICTIRLAAETYSPFIYYRF